MSDRAVIPDSLMIVAATAIGPQEPMEGLSVQSSIAGVFAPRFCWKFRSKSGYSLKTRRYYRPMEETVFQPVTISPSR